MTRAVRIAVIGLGEIAIREHLPAIGADPAFALVATVSPHHRGVASVAHFATFDDLLRDPLAVDAVAICTPPQVRYEIAAHALEHGMHVLLEKPPGATVIEVEMLLSLASQNKAVLFAAWHSRFAAGVASARAWLANRQIRAVRIVWREDVHVWHPGQVWIWEAGGLGVFDPGINALSIVTHILPHPFFFRFGELAIPSNREAPIAAALTFRDATGAAIEMDLDWRQTGPQTWDIVIETDAGTCALSKGGSILVLPGETMQGEDQEYPGLYRHFADLIGKGVSDVDVTPLKLVADAFLRAGRTAAAPFED